MRLQLTQQIHTDSAKADGMWCALSLELRSDSSVLRLSYLGKETALTSIQASAFTVSNPQNPEANKAAPD
jgi:hypothetical protein